VFGIYRRNGQVYAEIVENCRKDTLQAIDPRAGGAGQHGVFGRAGAPTTG